MEGIHISSLCWVMCWIIVQSSETGSKPVLSPLSTIDGCTDCFVGEDGVRTKVCCEVGDGDGDYNVTIKAGNTSLGLLDIRNKGKYQAYFYMNSSIHHMAKLSCSVQNNSTNETFTAETIIYVRVETYRPPSLDNIPTQLYEGDALHTCLKANIRPPATNITMMIGGKVVEGLIPLHDFDNSTMLYSSYVTLKNFQRHWNQKNITCCDSPDNFTTCSPPKTVNCIFPPSNVSLSVENNSDYAKQCYIMIATCNISHANPQCNATWRITNGVIVNQIDDEIKNNSEDNSVTSLHTAMIHVNMSVTDSIGITCTPACAKFSNQPGKSKSIQVNAKTMKPGDDDNDNSSTPELIAGIVGAVVFIVVCVLAIVIYKRKTKKDDKTKECTNVLTNTGQKPSDNIPGRDSEEMQELQQQPGQQDNNEGEQDVQLNYVDVEFVASGQPSCRPNIKRRESQVDYGTIDIVKTADMATKDEPIPDEATIYINH